VRDLVQEGHVKVMKIEGENNTSDVLTKNVVEKIHSQIFRMGALNMLWSYTVLGTGVRRMLKVLPILTWLVVTWIGTPYPAW
jgi:hypothetical protein